MSSTESRRIWFICGVSIDTPPLQRGDVALEARARAERDDRRAVRGADPHDRGRLLAVARVDDDVGRGGGVPALVGAVPAALVGAGDDAVGIERGDQLLLQAHRQHHTSPGIERPRDLLASFEMRGRGDLAGGEGAVVDGQDTCAGPAGISVRTSRGVRIVTLATSL